MSGASNGKAKFASLLLLFQGILLILFVVFVDYGDELLPSDPGKLKKVKTKELGGNVTDLLCKLIFKGKLWHYKVSLV